MQQGSLILFAGKFVRRNCCQYKAKLYPLAESTSSDTLSSGSSLRESSNHPVSEPCGHLSSEDGTGTCLQGLM